MRCRAVGRAVAVHGQHERTEAGGEADVPQPDRPFRGPGTGFVRVLHVEVQQARVQLCAHRVAEPGAEAAPPRGCLAHQEKVPQARLSRQGRQPRRAERHQCLYPAGNLTMQPETAVMPSSRHAIRVSITRRRSIERRGPVRRCCPRSVSIVRGRTAGVSVGVHRHRRIHRARRQGRGGADRRRAPGGGRRNGVHQRVHVRGPRIRDRRTLRVPSHQRHQPVPGQHLHPDTPDQPSYHRDHPGHSTHTTSSQRHALGSRNRRHDRRNGRRDRPRRDARRSATPPRGVRVASTAGPANAEGTRRRAVRHRDRSPQIRRPTILSSRYAVQPSTAWSSSGWSSRHDSGRAVITPGVPVLRPNSHSSGHPPTSENRVFSTARQRLRLRRRRPHAASATDNGPQYATDTIGPASAPPEQPAPYTSARACSTTTRPR